MFKSTAKTKDDTYFESRARDMLITAARRRALAKGGKRTMKSVLELLYRSPIWMTIEQALDLGGRCARANAPALYALRPIRSRAPKLRPPRARRARPKAAKLLPLSGLDARPLIELTLIGWS